MAKVSTPPTDLRSNFGTCPTCGAPLAKLMGCDECGYMPPDPLVGKILAEKYLIESLLGQGGMGRVYRATHLELGEPVAVKFLLRQWAALSEVRTRFRREAVALAKLRHPGIVSVLDFGEHEEDLYMVMELVQGRTLASELREGPFPIIRVGPIFDAVLQVLEVAHQARIIHRDLKPENVMLTHVGDRTDHVKILDFGLVRLDQEGEKRITETGTVHGTPIYMSPEQCRGINVGTPTDIYAVGIMLYETIAGATPFEGESSAGIMAQHMFVNPPPMAETGRKRTVSPALEALVQRALAKHPEERPTAAEFRDELAAVLRGTDAISLGLRSAEERARAANLTRGERAITGVVSPEGASSESVATGQALIWLEDETHAKALRNALAVNGIKSLLWDRSDTPPLALGADPVKVVIVDATSQGIERLGPLAARGTKVVAVGTTSAEANSELIRKGASDIAMKGVSDDEIVAKVRRVFRRVR